MRSADDIFCFIAGKRMSVGISRTLAEEIWERDEDAQSTEQIFGGCAGVSAED
jgi:hypothetical protein